MHFCHTFNWNGSYVDTFYLFFVILWVFCLWNWNGLIEFLSQSIFCCWDIDDQLTLRLWNIRIEFFCSHLNSNNLYALNRTEYLNNKKYLSSWPQNKKCIWFRIPAIDQIRNESSYSLLVFSVMIESVPFLELQR